VVDRVGVAERDVEDHSGRERLFLNDPRDIELETDDRRRRPVAAPRNAVGTTGEYTRGDLTIWVIVVREPAADQQRVRRHARRPVDRSRGLGSVRHRDDERDPLRPARWERRRDRPVFSKARGWRGHREVATDLFTRDDVRPLVGALPHFDVLAPTEQGDSGDTAESTPEERHVE